MRQARTWMVSAVALAVIAGLAAPDAWAARLDQAAIFIEINDTDGDAGIQIFLDGEGWDTMQVFGPNGRMVMGVVADGSVGFQGITEFFIESAEPSFDEQPLEDFLALFPAGIYSFRGRTTDGRSLIGAARLTHRIPEGPEVISPEEDGDPLPIDDAVIEWETVPNPEGSRITSYEIIVEREEPSLRVFRADMGNRQTRVTIPREFLQRRREYKVEVIAIERSGNRTISEVEFEVD
ncbi:MAG: hypothetical protein O7A98_02235 [Acidobacteria bacterium]|nr:hypothetical protein [Acidobacteriota bacterium]